MNNRVSDGVFGLFLVAAGLGLSIFMALGGINPDLLRPHTLFHAELDQGSGITGGMHVTVIGRRVGYVSDIELTNHRTVAVAFLVESRYAHHVRTDSEVGVIRTLAGRSVDIGLGEGEAAAEGSTLPGGRNIDPLLLVQASNLDANFHRLERILSDLTAISEQVGLGDGKIAAQISHMITQVESGRGTIGKLLMDDQASDEVFAALKDVDSMATDLSAAAKELQGTGIALTQAAQPLASAGTDLSKVAMGLQGSTQKLDGALDALAKSLSSLDSSMQQLDKTLVAIQNMPIVRGQVKKLDREDEAP
jgi:ABC-type transporter Mla subunit MlaD